MRWRVSAAIALGISESLERSGVPDARFAWQTTRALYADPTLSTGEEDPEVVAAVDEFLIRFDPLTGEPS